MWEKKKELPNVTKVQLHVMLVLRNSRMIPSNVRKKIKKSLNVIKSTVTCGVGIVQCVDGAIKCEKK